jgi:CRISPR/Cas system-associated protein Cas5 (RAMP superfamily)
MSLKGNLETFLLHTILQLLHDDIKTGVFHVSRKNEQVKIYFYKGDIIYATGSRKENRLGNLLLQRGLISKTELNEYLIGAQGKKQALGKYLVERKTISVEILKELLEKQTENIIYNLFLWEKGVFEYKDASLKMDGLINIQLSVMKIILDASRRIDEMSIFKKQIGSDEIILKVSNNNEKKDKIKFSPSELRMLKLIDGKRTVREIFSESGYNELTIQDEFYAYKTIHSLISSGMIEKIEPVHKGSVQIEERKNNYNAVEIITVYNDILQSTYRQVESELGKQTFTIFVKCKSKLSPQHMSLLKDFYPGHPAATNIHAIMHALDISMDSAKIERFIINCFNKYFIEIIVKTSSILGTKFHDKIRSEIEKMFSIVNENKKSSTEIKQIKTSIENILNQNWQQIDYD